MSRETIKDLKPFISVLVIISSLFIVAFAKMEIRRAGYDVLQLARAERKMRDYHRHQLVALAKITRPDRLQSLAQSRLNLNRAEAGQIIQMTEHGIALKQ